MFGEAGALAEGERELTVDLPLYGHEGLFRACYAFTDRCFMFLREAWPSTVTLVCLHLQSPKSLTALNEEFANELISQRLRAQLAAETKNVREMIVAQAFAESDL